MCSKWIDLLKTIEMMFFVHMGEAPLFIHIKYKHKNSKHRNRNTIILPVPTSGNRYRFP